MEMNTANRVLLAVACALIALLVTIGSLAIILPSKEKEKGT